MFFDKEIETMPRQKLEELQLEKLKKLAVYCYKNVPLYKKKFDDAKFDPEKINQLSDIEYMPYTTKEDFRDNYPYGMFAVPLKKIVRFHASSGTTGKPTVVGYTKSDLDMWSDCVARLVTAAGITDEDIIQIAFGYGLFTGALGLHYGLEKVGATVIPTSSGNTEKQIMLMKDFGTTGLVSTPSYAQYIGEIARELGYDLENDIKLKHGIFGSEGCTVEMRTQIEQSLHVFATDNYGMSELIGPGVSGECTFRNGMHFAEDHFLPEIIDSHTLKTLDKGETGELVITTLSKEALPVLRYRTKDITRLNYDICECGRTHCRMEKVKGRSDDMLKIRGVNIFPSQVESVIMIVPQVAPHYQLVVERAGAHDTLEVKCELVDSTVLDSLASLEAVKNKIHHDLKNVLGIDTKVTLVEPKTLTRFQGKAQRILDLRDKK